MSASSLHVFLSPASICGAGPEPRVPGRPAGTQASTGLSAWASAARGGLKGLTLGLP